jgi:hypothetical protein
MVLARPAYGGGCDEGGGGAVRVDPMVAGIGADGMDVISTLTADAELNECRRSKPDD